MRSLATLILQRLGWSIKGYEQLYKIPKFILIVAPHTSNWDFPLGILIRKAARLDNVKFLGKSSLFRFPFGWVFKSLGGYPVERSQSNNLVQSYIDIFNSKKEFAIVMAPEGTRKKVEHFKTGFYFIARGAGIPIVPCIFDYAKKECSFLEPFSKFDDAEKDIQYLESLFRGIPGKNTKYNF